MYTSHTHVYITHCTYTCILPVHLHTSHTLVCITYSAYESIILIYWRTYWVCDVYKYTHVYIPLILITSYTEYVYWVCDVYMYTDIYSVYTLQSIRGMCVHCLPSTCVFMYTYTGMRRTHVYIHIPYTQQCMYSICSVYIHVSYTASLYRVCDVYTEYKIHILIQCIHIHCTLSIYIAYSV